MYDLARQMIRLGQNVWLYTGIPRFKIERDLRPIANTRIRGVITERIANTIAPTFWKPQSRSDRTLEDFGRWVAGKVGQVDLVDALAGTGLELGRVLADRGTPWICNRGSTHILTQKKLLDYEHDRWNVPRIQFSREGIDRCLAEYEEADGIVVPSAFNKRTFIDEGVNEKKIYVCSYGVSLEMFRPEPKQDDKFRILFVGIASLRKGIGYLFDAIRPLVARRQVECWLIGSMAEDAKDLLKNNADIFIYKGPQPRESLSWCYSQGSVLVLPSIEEGLALVQAQAMACGLPVIATTNTGAEDLFTDGVEGFITSIRNPEEIRKKIEYFLDCPQKAKEMSVAAIQRVSRIGGWNQYGEKCLSTYEEIVNKKGSYALADDRQPTSIS